MRKFFGKVGEVSHLAAFLIVMVLSFILVSLPVFGSMAAIFAANEYADSRGYNDSERAGLLILSCLGQGVLSILILVLVGKYYEIL
jgi:hypothetical protein